MNNIFNILITSWQICIKNIIDTVPS